jgi:hypothetical protein
MNFRIQMRQHQADNKTTWAVTLNGEHIMFVGDFCQCEQWLDALENWPTSNATALSSAPVQRDATPGNRSQARVSWLLNGLKRGAVKVVTSMRRSATAFLSNDRGNCTATEALMVFVLVAAMYLGLAFTVVHGCREQRGGVIGTRVNRPEEARYLRPVINSHSRAPNDDTLEIVCDPMPSGT